MDSAKQDFLFPLKIALLLIFLNTQPIFASEVLKPAKMVVTKSNVEEAVKRLEQYAIDLAKNDIHQSGTFTPFGVSIDTGGHFNLVTGSGQDTTQDLEMITNAYKKKAQKSLIAAAAIVFDTKIENPGKEGMDAIYITCDSIFTPTKNKYLLYFKTKSGAYKFTGLIKSKKDNTKIFSSSKFSAAK